MLENWFPYAREAGASEMILFCAWFYECSVSNLLILNHLYVPKNKSYLIMEVGVLVLC
jgi:hypothetical protein